MSLPHVDEALRATIGPEWLQGRTAFGGASAAIALSAVKQSILDLPPLRSMQIAFIGPIVGEVEAKPTLLRRGRNSVFVGCDVFCDGAVGLRALFLFMGRRESTISHVALPSPEPSAPEANPIDAQGLPQGFLQQFDLAQAGENPAAGWLRWARLRAREGLDPEVELVAIADALPPAAMALAEQWGPISSTTWQLNLLGDGAVSRDGWWLIGAETLQAGDGSSSQAMTIWDRDGRPVATATQSVALFI